MTHNPAVTTFLWFHSQAAEAATFYTSLIPGSALGEITPGPGGTALLVSFTLDGQHFTALNGGPAHTLTPAVSISVRRDTQQQVDALWEALTADGGEPGPCGWLTDRFGLSWQVIPSALPELLSDPDPAKAAAVGAAMQRMTKIDIQGLRDAYAAA